MSHEMISVSLTKFKELVHGEVAKLMGMLTHDYTPEHRERCRNAFESAVWTEWTMPELYEEFVRNARLDNAFRSETLPLRRR